MLNPNHLANSGHPPLVNLVVNGGLRVVMIQQGMGEMYISLNFEAEWDSISVFFLQPSMHRCIQGHKYRSLVQKSCYGANQKREYLRNFVMIFMSDCIISYEGALKYKSEKLR
jgi:hypothetical protein